MAKKAPARNKKQGVSNEDMFEVLVFLKDTVEHIDASLKRTVERVGNIEENMATKDDVRNAIEDLRTTDIRELRDRVGNLEKGQDEILDTLRPLSKAYDKDALMLLDHDTRIVRLEKQVVA